MEHLAMFDFYHFPVTSSEDIFAGSKTGRFGPGASSWSAAVPVGTAGVNWCWKASPWVDNCSIVGKHPHTQPQDASKPRLFPHLCAIWFALSSIRGASFQKSDRSFGAEWWAFGNAIFQQNIGKLEMKQKSGLARGRHSWHGGGAAKGNCIMKSGSYCTNLGQINSRKLLNLLLKHISP